MKVLLVNTYFYMRGGAERSTFNTAELLHLKGHQTVHFAMHHPQNFPSNYSKYFSYYIDFPKEMAKNTLKSLLKVLKTTFYNHYAKEQLTRLLRKERPDVAHLNNFLHHLSISVLYGLRKRCVPIVWTLRDYTIACPNTSFLDDRIGEVCESCHKMRYFMAPIRRCKKGSFSASLIAMLEEYFNRLCGALRFVDVFIAPSRFLKKKMIQYGLPGKRILHIPNFVKASDYNPKYSGGEHFLYIGRLSREKGLKTLLKAMRRLREGRLLIVGEGPQRNELEDYVRDNNLDNVKFLGHLSGDKLKRVVDGAVAVVVPSEWYEVFGLVIVEAYAAGKPVVASRIGGIPELVRDGVTGLLFEPANADELAEGMNRLVRNPNMATEMGREARELAEECYSPDAHYEMLIRAYRMAAENREMLDRE